MNKQFAIRWLSLFALFNLIVFSVACSTSWVTEAEGIIGALVPAVEGILVILSGLGAKFASPSVISAVQSWGTKAENDLQTVVLPLIQQYSSAAAADQPGILGEIQAGLDTISNDLTVILPTLKVTDPVLQAKIDAIVAEVDDEFKAVLNLIPVIKNAATPAAAMKALAAKPEVLNKLKSEKQFKKDYNSKAAAFGDQFKNWIK